MAQFVFESWRDPDVVALALALAVAAFVTVVRRSPRAPWLAGAAWIVIVAAIAAVSVQFDLVGWHGFMHGAPILHMLDGGPVPPEDPLFAGGTLRYPWFEHWLMATASRLTGTSPHLLTIELEIVALGVFLAAGGWLASAVTRDRETITLAVLLTGAGISVTHGGPIADAIGRAFSWLSLETRAIPVDKFASITAMPVGFAAFAIAAAAGVHAANRPEEPRPMLHVIAAATLVAALFHPLSWSGVLMFEAVVVLVLLASRRRRDAVVALGIVAAVVGPSLLALPYLRSIGISESSDGWSGLTDSVALLNAKLWDLALFLAPFAAVVYACRRRLAELLDDDGRALRILLLAIVVMAAAYVAIRHPGRNEYKHLLFLSLPAATLLAICLRELFERQFAIALAMTVMLLLPGMRALGVRPWFWVTDPCVLEGPYLRLREPAGGELYHWIATETPLDSVFLAADLRVPPLGRRSLYIPVSTPWRGRDGWGVTRDQLLQWHVRRPDDVMQRRQRLATMVLDANWMQWNADGVIAQIRKDIGRRPLFAHIVDPNAAAVLDRTPGFGLKFRNPAGSVYAIDG